ncbi:hypothetical protein MMC09_002098 [Bachmanniomyces sp. S44760]|nr:hypothetical protein [Bachmanniomyces sp. S44760]
MAKLRPIAISIGVNSTGKKDQLVSRISEDLQTKRWSAQDCSPSDGRGRLISIDMGIRNLAYCRIAVLPRRACRTSANSIPFVEDWQRIAVSEQVKVVTSNESGLLANTKESFDPALYSEHAYELVTTLLTPKPQPSHILIERQRFRSMGGSAVQEWTLRVNMFESMLYAVLETFRQQGLWKGRVWPIAPSKVNKYWLPEDKVEVDRTQSKGRIHDTKTAKREKINLVRSWLEDKNKIAFVGPTEKVRQDFLSKAERKKRANASQPIGQASTSAIGKLDDLADCLLQGIAWVEWEENRRLVSAKGVEAIRELEEKLQMPAHPDIAD